MYTGLFRPREGSQKLCVFVYLEKMRVSLHNVHCISINTTIQWTNQTGSSESRLFFCFLVSFVFFGARLCFTIRAGPKGGAGPGLLYCVVTTWKFTHPHQLRTNRDAVSHHLHPLS